MSERSRRRGAAVEGRGYLVAAHRQRPRTYRVSRIGRATMLRERAMRPDDFDLHHWWTTSASAFDAAIRRSEVHIRVPPRGLQALPSALAMTMALDAGPPRHDGWYELEVRVESDEVAAHQLLALGPDVEVLGPLAVRRALASAGATMAALNR